MTGRSTFRWTQWRHYRKARWVVLAAALPVIWACTSRQLEVPGSAPTRTYQNVFQETVNRDVDVLFMVDNSRSMLPLQAKLNTQFVAFMQTLQALPGGQPNLHIAVVTSDMGSGANPVQLCNNDQGIFKSVVGPSATGCTATGLNAGEHFISSVNGQNNFTGKLENVFACIAAVGEDGCGFEAQLKSVARALGADGNAPPVENANFLRPSAYLAIVLITNEDDCSVPDDSNLFISGTGHQFVSDPEGPLVSYRCNEFGHLCRGMRPPRTTTATFAPGECVSAEDQGDLIPVHTFIDQIKTLKPLQSQILVAVIGGFPDPYTVDQVPPLIAQDPAPTWPQIHHSCFPNMDIYGDPGIRLAAFVNAFGGIYDSICADSFVPALDDIATAIGKKLGPKCVDGTPADKDSKAMGKAFMAGGEPNPECTVIDHSSDSMTGAPLPDVTVPACSDIQGGCTQAMDTNANCTTCWTLPAGSGMNCVGSHIMQVNRPAGNLPSSLNSSVSCSICINGVESPGCACVAGKTDMVLGCP